MIDGVYMQEKSLGIRYTSGFLRLNQDFSCGIGRFVSHLVGIPEKNVFHDEAQDIAEMKAMFKNDCYLHHFIYFLTLRSTPW